jgi:hypothetical protein
MVLAESGRDDAQLLNNIFSGEQFKEKGALYNEF